MEYKAFVKTVTEMLQQKVGKEYSVMTTAVPKINKGYKDAVILKKKSDSVSPVIYLDQCYSLYTEGIPIEVLIEKMVRFYNRFMPEENPDISFFTDFKRASPHLRCKVVNYEMNRRILGWIPCMKYLDLAVICYLQTGNAHSPEIIVNELTLNSWGVDFETLSRIAITNTMTRTEYGCNRLDTVIQEYKGTVTESVPAYLLTNKESTYGAAAILFPKILKRIGQDLGSFYILPSSINDCIVVPAEAGISPDCLREMLRDVNRTKVEKENLLSDSLYYYSMENGEFPVIVE